MSVLEAGPSIIVYHILPSFLAGLVYFFLAKFFIFIFRVKKPSIKFVLYFLVIYKILLLLTAGARYSYTQVPRKPFGFGFMFYDPADLLPFGSIKPVEDFSRTFQAFQSPFFVNVISIILLIIISMLVLRWIATVWFLKKAASDSEAPDNRIKRLVKNLSLKLKVKTPRIVTSTQNIGPLVIGITKPIIILPSNLKNKLNDEELQVIIGHELAHIKRKDNLWQWFALFIKDLLFYNPFAVITYHHLQLNKELATDSLFLNSVPSKGSLFKKTLQKVSSIQGGPAAKGLLLSRANFINSNLTKNRTRALDAIDPKNNKATILSTISAGSCIILFFWVKIWIAIKLGEKALLLLS